MTWWQSGASWSPQFRISDDGRALTRGQLLLRSTTSPCCRSIWPRLWGRDGGCLGSIHTKSKQVTGDSWRGPRTRRRPDVCVCSGLLHFAAHKLQFVHLSDTLQPPSKHVDHLTVYDTTSYTNYFIDVAGHGGACTVTANRRRHDLSAAFTRTNLRLPRLKEESRRKPFANTYRVFWGRGKSRAMGDTNRLRGNVSIT